MPADGWLPLVVDAALLTLFALHHSLFARDRPKAWIAQHVPVLLQRSIYVWIASLLLIGVCLLWQSIGGEIYRATGLLAHCPCRCAGDGPVADGERCGADRPARARGHSSPPDEAGGLQVTGPYGWVRHPLYLGWALMTFATAHMTGDRLAFATLTTLLSGHRDSVGRAFASADLRRSYERYSRAREDGE